MTQPNQTPSTNAIPIHDQSAAAAPSSAPAPGLEQFSFSPPPHAAPTRDRFALWNEILDVARYCPSPHNVQPWRVELVDQRTARICIDGTRTFPFTDHTGSFIISTMSMFNTYLSISAQNKGYRLDTEIADVHAIDLQAPRSHFATVRLTRDESLGAHEFSNEDLLRRVTSRRPHLHQSVPLEALKEISPIVKSRGYSVKITTDQAEINRLLYRDIAALFNDVNDPRYFNELKPFLKLGARETTLEGLHYQSMNMSWAGFAALKHYPFLVNLPVLNRLAAAGYRVRLGHTECMALIGGEFWEREGALKSGEMLINMWLTLSRHNLVIHPFGNLITNQSARQEVEQWHGMKDLWFVIRIGFTGAPVKSQRLTLGQLCGEAR